MTSPREQPGREHQRPEGVADDTVEEHDDGYYAAFETLEREARETLVGGRRPLFEAETEEDRRTHGLRHHEATPPAAE